MTCIEPECQHPACGESTLCAGHLIAELGISRCPGCGGEGSLIFGNDREGEPLEVTLNIPCAACALGLDRTPTIP